MKEAVQGITVLAAAALLAGTAWAQSAKPLKRCAPDAVIAGTVCMDTYEASVWRVPGPTTINKGLVKKIQQGKATAADLTAGGATQLGIGFTDNYAPCADSGQNCTDDIYAVSLPAVPPSANLTWFQAQAACENARKRLPSNAEWQAAVIGRPTPGRTMAARTVTPRACSWRSPPARAAAASRRAGPSTWWATSTSGLPTGCRDRRRVEPGAPA
jgi:hypothetical protein